MQVSNNTPLGCSLSIFREDVCNDCSPGLFSAVGIFNVVAVPSVDINYCYKLNLSPMQYAQTFPSHYGMSIAVICSAPTASCVAKQTIQKIYHVNPTTDVADIQNSLLHCTNTKRLTKGSQSS